jgi:hypothetical protein
MADEITIGRIRVELNKGNIADKVLVDIATQQWDQAGVGFIQNVVNVGTSEETLATTEIGTLGWAVFHNLDSTNYVRWGFSTTVYGGRLEPGEYAVFRLNPGVTTYMIANSAACEVMVTIIED